jgi:hypothetical protein
MQHPRRLAAIALASLVLTACSGPSPTPTTDVTALPLPSSEPAGTPVASDGGSPASTPELIPSDELGDFTCDPPIHVDQTVERANITDVRIGTHESYDRVVFEFSGGLPEASLERAEPPFTHDASGAPIAVEGGSFLRLIFRGGTKQTDDGTSSYEGPIDFDPGHHTLVDLVEGGDFEAQSTWYFGLTEAECVRVLALDDEPRIVIDIEH